MLFTELAILSAIVLVIGTIIVVTVRSS